MTTLRNMQYCDEENASTMTALRNTHYSDDTEVHSTVTPLRNRHYSDNTEKHNAVTTQLYCIT